MPNEQRQEIMRRHAEGMRAVSNEEIARRQREAADGARNAWPDSMPGQLAQGSQNWLVQWRGEIDVAPIVPPPSPTLWARFKRWIRG